MAPLQPKKCDAPLLCKSREFEEKERERWNFCPSERNVYPHCWSDEQVRLRTELLRTVSTSFAAVLHLAAQFYPRCRPGTTAACTLQSCPGQQQGDTLGPLLFALGMQPALEAVHENFLGHRVPTCLMLHATLTSTILKACFGAPLSVRAAAERKRLYAFARTRLMHVRSRLAHHGSERALLHCVPVDYCVTKIQACRRGRTCARSTFTENAGSSWLCSWRASPIDTPVLDMQPAEQRTPTQRTLAPPPPQAAAREPLLPLLRCLAITCVVRQAWKCFLAPLTSRLRINASAVRSVLRNCGATRRPRGDAALQPRL